MGKILEIMLSGLLFVSVDVMPFIYFAGKNKGIKLQNIEKNQFIEERNETILIAYELGQKSGRNYAWLNNSPRQARTDKQNLIITDNEGNSYKMINQLPEKTWTRKNLAPYSQPTTQPQNNPDYSKIIKSVLDSSD